MHFTRLLRQIALSPLRALVDIPEIRRRIIFDVKQRHFNQLDIAVPLGFHLNAPICAAEFWVSFEEIFFTGEYTSLLENIVSRTGFPTRWLDLGCHAGFFSLWLLYESLKSGQPISDCRALLIDPDPRIVHQVSKLISLNRLESTLQFLPAAISHPAANESNTTKFAVRSYMSSSLAEIGGQSSDICLVKTINAEDLTKHMSPPYDLIKIDIEGAEFDFLTAYEDVWISAKHIILECHSWHSGGGGSQQLRKLAIDKGFRVLQDLPSPEPVTINGKAETCSILLLENTARAKVQP